MGSEGYLINEFIVKKTNRRRDAWGGAYEQRIRFPIEIVRRIRAEVGPRFIIIYRLSMLDLVEDGSTWDEVVLLARRIAEAGATLINTGIGWHEARVPTIAMSVPRAAFAALTRRMRGEVSIPLITSNRINTPELAEQVLAAGDADMVSMARPLLADPDFVLKSARGVADEINTCIACNQACLDHVFQGKLASCLVNPRACRETNAVFAPEPVKKKKRIAVVGAGPAGLSFATVAGERGHSVVLFEAEPAIGGQFNMARKIPGKEEFSETLRYFQTKLSRAEVELRLGKRVTAAELLSGGFDEIVLATGVVPRTPKIEGIDHPKVLSYIDVLKNERAVGRRVAIIGAGGIGFDVAEYLTHDGERERTSLDREAFWRYWGIDIGVAAPGGLTERRVPAPPREVWLLQRKAGKHGASLGKTTGWIHRSMLKDKRVNMLGDVSYDRIDDRGLHLSAGGKPLFLEVDHVVVCAGQEPLRELLGPLEAQGRRAHVIGGADRAVELDAKRAIDAGARLAAEV
jgi:2,4-dienoyl-CoA reductase (NADPH2)